MKTSTHRRPSPSSFDGEHSPHEIHLWTADSGEEVAETADSRVTGQQVLELFGKHPADEHVLLVREPNGMLEEIGPAEPVTLDANARSFFAFRTDRTFHVVLDGRRFPWGETRVDEPTLRRIGAVPPERELVLERHDEPDKTLGPDDSVRLAASGLERLRTQAKSWTLDVQGKRISSATPTIGVKEAIRLAGFDPDASWIAILRQKGEPKKALGIGDTIDLSRPGIERLRLTPGEIVNGEGATTAPDPVRRFEFALPLPDRTFLDAAHLDWECVVDGNRRWLVLGDYPLPAGYSHEKVDVAIEVPPTYPTAALDMFYCSPAVHRTDGRPIPQTQVTVFILGRNFQRWSRHRGQGSRWNPHQDSLATHLALVEESLEREVDR